jgi:hypothetical protein
MRRMPNKLSFWDFGTGRKYSVQSVLDGTLTANTLAAMKMDRLRNRASINRIGCKSICLPTEPLPPVSTIPQIASVPLRLGD